MTAEDARKLRQARPDKLIMEGVMVRFHPQWLRAREIIRSGELGDVRAVRSVFSYFNDDPANVRNKVDIGGGAILDIGCYPLTGGRFFFESKPLRVLALVDRDPEFGTDRQASVVADYGSGRQLSFVVSTQLVPHQSIEVLGTRARLEILIPFNAPQGEATTLLVDHGYSFDKTLSRREVFPPSDQYMEMADAFAQAILGGVTAPYDLEDAIASMETIDALFESERRGGWVDIAKSQPSSLR